MDERAKIPPGLPRPNPTVSYWQDPPDEIADLCSSDSLPETAEYVIVGSGISGASIAYNLLKRNPNASIVMLEARQAVSGATGRNGGHTKAASYRSFMDHETKVGVSEAIKFARMEYANIKATHAFAREHNIDCASNPCDTVDIMYSEAHFTAGRAAIARMQKVMGPDDPAAAYKFHTAAETAAKFLTPTALGAIVYEAGSLSSYKFAIGVLKLGLAAGLALYTHTPAVSISPAPAANPAHWTVHTPKGPITTPALILATNGYTPHLLPQTQGLIVPLRGQVSAQRPGSRMPQHGLETTFSFIYDSGYDYMISRPAGTADAGTIVIGGGLGLLPADGAAEFGETDDRTLNADVSAYLTDSMAKEGFFGANWGEDHAEGRIAREWSGIMGTSCDGIPYVGAMPDMPGVWISASFNGHGMVLCLKSAEALVGMMVDGEKGSWTEWFPRSMEMSKHRFGQKFVGRLGMRAPGEAEFGDRLRENGCGKL